ncbi:MULTISPECIES: hypothetical protein [unclassified Leptolyngbya]|uniref:hypothetical protein n=1 Tax=unclassified Leptolyngbya TaxID=2650499 RepID=UPI0016872F9B|nr:MULTISPECIES: hypothetical protein [unclassified Leptolyngbya]MBD1910093.1 hypothetical protein [Leptolyngbya sp. FACHB-8]MBD2156865.1 hypothetical protein [Leptolyngbya sp. FACHB-16]
MTRPRFSNTATWQQAEILMQPVFIRLVDNLRKELDQSQWHGRYQEEAIWPDSVPLETRSYVMELQQQLAKAAPEQALTLEEALARLPKPQPSYTLCLERNGRTVTLDLWQLCYQICFSNYHPLLHQDEEVTVDVDTSLLDETGDVDWQRLDAKTHEIVHQIFASLSPQDDESS